MIKTYYYGQNSKSDILSTKLSNATGVEKIVAEVIENDIKNK